jgi:DNA ligase (NAD+)
MNIQEKIKELETKIVRYSEAYYLGEAITSDEEFDSLVNELKSIDPNNRLIKMVSFGVSVYGEKEELPVNIRKSLNKIHDANQAFNGGLGNYYVSPKVDGFSVILKYSNGILEKAWTREGLIITEKCKYIKNIPHIVKEITSEIYLRGELYISWEDFENLKEDYVNPRNAMGLITRKSFENLEYVTFYLHPFQSSVVNNTTFLFDHFKDPFDSMAKGFSHNGENLNNILESIKKEYSKICQVDGLVGVNKEMYHTSEFPEEHAFAFKFATEEVETEVEDIEWNLSNRGKLIPIVKYKPVQLYGTTCKQCSGYNYKYVKDNKLGKGSKIRLTKANEIIPYITKVESEGQFEDILINGFNENLKAYKLKLDENETHLVVASDSYFRRQRAENFIKACIDFDGFKRSEIILDLYKYNLFANDSSSLGSISELLMFFDDIKSGTISKEDFLQALKDVSIVSLGEDIYNKILNFKVNIELFLSYFGIDSLGESASKKLLKDLGRLYDIYEKRETLSPKLNKIITSEEVYEEIIEIVKQSGVNIRVINIFRDPDILASIMNAYEWLSKNKRFEIVESKKFNTTVVITGSLKNYTKSEMKKKLEQHGVKVEASISKSIDYLICEDVNGNSSKLQFARKNNIPLITEEEALSKFIN